MNNIEFKPEVYGDIKVAYDWYESQRIGKPEVLKENLSGFHSRRIDEGNRLVYTVEEK